MQEVFWLATNNKTACDVCQPGRTTGDILIDLQSDLAGVRRQKPYASSWQGCPLHPAPLLLQLPHCSAPLHLQHFLKFATILANLQRKLSHENLVSNGSKTALSKAVKTSQWVPGFEDATTSIKLLQIVLKRLKHQDLMGHNRKPAVAGWLPIGHVPNHACCVY